MIGRATTVGSSPIERPAALADPLTRGRELLLCDLVGRADPPHLPRPGWLPWWLRPATRGRMERGLAAGGLVALTGDEVEDVPLLCAVVRGRRWAAPRGYRFVAEGPFGRLRLVMLVPANPRRAVVVCLDGPSGAGTASPHRNAAFGPHGYELCLYYPGDPAHRRWEPADGLVALADIARAHVAREHVWRIEWFWPGAEAPHGAMAKAA